VTPTLKEFVPEWPTPDGVGDNVRIDIWSDIVCPWCYLGSLRLATAIQRFTDAHPEQQPSVRWRAYELDPAAPADPRPMRPVIDAKYGPGAFDAMTTRLTALGAAEGIEYRFEDTLRVNTFDAHRLMAWAGSLDDAEPAGAQDRLSDVLFRSYFTDGLNIAEHPVLVDLAGTAGLDTDRATEVLASGAFADEVRADEATAREHDVTGVPATVVDGRLLVPGAQEVDTFLRVLERAAVAG